MWFERASLRRENENVYKEEKPEEKRNQSPRDPSDEENEGSGIIQTAS